MNRAIEAFVTSQIVDQFGNQYEKLKLRRSGAGCINETWEAYGDGLQSLFVKVGRQEAETMYQREMEGLALLAQADKLRIPQAYQVAANEDCAILLMEFIPLQPLRLNSEIALGEGLAQLHSMTAERFGLAEDNFIGRSRQVNGFADDWWSFYCEKRLAVQLDMASSNGMRGELQERIKRIIDVVPQFFSDHQPQASLLHGDLWNGNVSADSGGMPVIYDPAVYYGDAETDIAMSQMFQRLGNAVYEEYYHQHPPKPGYEVRRNLYDLYHWMNHFNLFGVTYLGQVEHAVDAILYKII